MLSLFLSIISDRLSTSIIAAFTNHGNDENDGNEGADDDDNDDSSGNIVVIVLSTSKFPPGVETDESSKRFEH